MDNPKKRSSPAALFMLLGLVAMGGALGYLSWRWMNPPSDIVPTNIEATQTPQAEQPAAPQPSAPSSGDRAAG